MPSSLLRRTASQLFMVGIPGPSLDRETRTFLAEYAPGGVILFKRNVRSAAQLRQLVAEIHELGAGVLPLVGLDHEGLHASGQNLLSLGLGLGPGRLARSLRRRPRLLGPCRRFLPLG